MWINPQSKIYWGYQQKNILKAFMQSPEHQCTSMDEFCTLYTLSDLRASHFNSVQGPVVASFRNGEWERKKSARDTGGLLQCVFFPGDRQPRSKCVIAMEFQLRQFLVATGWFVASIWLTVCPMILCTTILSIRRVSAIIWTLKRLPAFIKSPTSFSLSSVLEVDRGPAGIGSPVLPIFFKHFVLPKNLSLC